jgi:hypothetical protein
MMNDDVIRWLQLHASAKVAKAVSPINHIDIDIHTTTDCLLPVACPTHSLQGHQSFFLSCVGDLQLCLLWIGHSSLCSAASLHYRHIVN